MKHNDRDNPELAELQARLASGTLTIIEQVRAEARIKQLDLIRATGPGAAGVTTAEKRSNSGAIAYNLKDDAYDEARAKLKKAKRAYLNKKWRDNYAKDAEYRESGATAFRPPKDVSTSRPKTKKVAFNHSHGFTI